MPTPHLRARPVRSVALAVLVAAVATACGVAADTTAGSVGDRTVSVDDVDALARDEMFVGVPGSDLPESRLPGDLARIVLAFELERAALHEELSQWGLAVTDADREETQASLAAEEGAGWEELEPRSREVLADYFAAQQQLGAHFAQLDTDDETLRRFYDRSPMLWAQTCATIVGVDPSLVEEASAAVAEGVALEDLPESVVGAEVVVSVDEQCVDDAQVLPELRDAFADAIPGEVPDPVLIDAGLPSAFFFRVDERRVVDFDEARPQLEELVGSFAVQGPMAWVRLMLADAEVDARFGSGVTQNPDGSIVVDPPVTPPVRAPEPGPEPMPLGELDDIPLDDAPPEDPFDEVAGG